jgi:hypothetical protein
MDPIDPWLDPSEVRHLAEQLLRPLAPARVDDADPGFDPSFVGFMGAPDATAEKKIASLPSEIITPAPSREPEPPVAETPPIQIDPQPAPEPSPGEEPPAAAEPESPLLECIRIFRDWLAENFQATDIFVLDHEGEVVFDESGHGRLHFMARSFALGPSKSGNIHIKIGPSAILEIIPCETSFGRIVLGALLPESLSAKHVQTITEVLIHTASPA